MVMHGLFTALDYIITYHLGNPSCSRESCLLHGSPERYSNLAKEKLGTDALDTQLQYSIRLYCQGSVGMTRESSLRIRLVFPACGTIVAHKTLFRQR